MLVGHQTQFDRENEINSIVETLGDSNVIQIFVHSVTSLGNLVELAATVPGIEKYPERALLIARPDDIVCVAGIVDKDYLQFLSSLGIGPRNGNVLVGSKNVHRDSNVSLSDLIMRNDDALLRIKNLIKRDKQIVLNPFIVTLKEFKLAATMERLLDNNVHLLGGNSFIVDYANRKHNIRAKAIELGIRVPDGETVDLELGQNGKPYDLTPIQVAINKYIHKTGKVIIKGSYGASGFSIIIVESSPESVNNALSKIANSAGNSIYIVEEMLEVTFSPNILMHIKPDCGRISCVCVTDQLLSDDLIHQGNAYPSSARTLPDMINSAQGVSKWLQGKGYSGLVGFDFGEYSVPGTREIKHFLAEINPRINAATYPKSLMEHLNRKQRQKGAPYIEAFVSANIKTNARSFAELHESYGHLFFKPEIGKGLVPYNVGCLENGKFTMAFFGKSRNEVEEMYEDFKNELTEEA
jgi:hypothetical protein